MRPVFDTIPLLETLEKYGLSASPTVAPAGGR
jgi:hypothetical protein